MRRALAAAPPTHVFHLAVERRFDTSADQRRTLATNVVGTADLLDACAAHAPAAIVCGASSLEARRAERAQREEDPIAPDSSLGAVKAAQTVVARQRARALELPVSFLRVFSAYGPFEPEQRLLPSLARAAIHGHTLQLTPPGFRHDFVFVADVVEALVAAAEAALAPGEMVNIGTGVETSNEEVVALMEEVSGVRLDVEWGAYPPRATDTAHWRADITRAREVLGWQPAFDLRRGIRETLAWWREQT
jgi:nucleoside-diphosphate-sugar epimerase